MEIAVKNLTKSFKGIKILNNVNITFKSKKIIALVGRNGSGKSVLLKLLCGLYLPTEGEILFDNINYNLNDEYPPNTRALIEKPTFMDELTGFENLKLLAKIQNLISDKEINEALKIVNLYDDKDKKFKHYSLGMKQKLGIAQVIMENPDVMIFDEPFNGIEKRTAEKLRKYLKEKKEEGKLIIIATHIKEDVEELADLVYEVDDGNVKKQK
ncbi:MAG: ATP-binding cassette domain-containing protein [Bacilli bacterium]|jgi:ABC-2 type transport system ATP-binding protein|nr:ATP-binding cassette domain-containing protein [Bacilli bacterium]